jgi:hypothetical protein
MASRLLEKLAAVNKEREKLLITLEMLRSEGADIPEELSRASSPPPTVEGVPPASTTFGVTRMHEVRPDTYFGLSIHKAARKYLQDLGHADRLENVMASLTAGGVTVGGARPLETLRAVLRQNTAVFVRVSESTFGLRDFYPHIGEPKPEKPKPGRRKRRARAKDKQGNGKATRPKTTKAAIAEDKGDEAE